VPALPTPTVTTLPNGLRVFVLPDAPDAGPTLRGALIMRGGQRASPDAALGVATLAAAVQRTGGARAHPAAFLDALLDDLSADVDVSAAPDATAISFECASEDAATVLGVVGELVTQPALPPAKLALAQAQVANLLRHRDDNPAAVPGREAGRRVYGPRSVHARSPTVEQVKAITPADVAAYLAAWQRPDAAVLTLVGDVGDPKAAAALAADALGAWREDGGVSAGGSSAALAWLGQAWVPGLTGDAGALGVLVGGVRVSQWRAAGAVGLGV
jgi:zinc protease